MVPARLRKKLKWKTGEVLNCRPGEYGIIIDTPQDALERLQKMFAKLKVRGSMADELIRQRRREAERELRD